MVEALVEIGRQRGLAGVAAGPVAAVVAQRDGLGERHVEATGAGDAGRHLRHLEGVGEPGAEVVGGEDEDLRLAGEAAERGRVQDPVAVAFEAGSQRVGRLGVVAATGTSGERSTRNQVLALGDLTLRAIENSPDLRLSAVFISHRHHLAHGGNATDGL